MVVLPPGLEDASSVQRHVPHEQRNASPAQGPPTPLAVSPRHGHGGDGAEPAVMHARDAAPLPPAPTPKRAASSQQQHQYHADPTADSCSDEDVIRLNVGGTHYSASRAVLTVAAGSYLASAFSGRWPLRCSHEGEVFLDRDGTSFRYILQHLRTLQSGAGGPALLPASAVELQLLATEADFYGLPDFSEVCAAAAAAATAGAATSTGARGGGGGTDAGGAAAAPAALVPVPVEAMLAAAQGTRMHAAASGVLLRSVQAARAAWLEHEAAWVSNAHLAVLRDLFLAHAIVMPLEAGQVDLQQALARPVAGTRIEVSMRFFSFGDVRIELEAALHSGSCSACAEAQSSSSSGGSGSATPDVSGTGAAGALGDAAAAAVAAAAAAAAPGGAGPRMLGRSASMGERAPSQAAAAASLHAALPGSGGGSSVARSAQRACSCSVKYHTLRIRETPSTYLLQRFMPGEGAPRCEEHTRNSFLEQLGIYSSLHKLLVQQSPRPLFAGLVWLLQAEGFRRVTITTQQESYLVGEQLRHAFPGTMSTVTLHL